MLHNPILSQQDDLIYRAVANNGDLESLVGFISTEQVITAVENEAANTAFREL